MEFLQPEWREKLTSTNTVLLERLKGGETLAEGYVLAALEQSAGRGRYRRTWVSRPGRDLTFSFVLRSAVQDEHRASLPMAVALGVAQMLEVYGLDARAKWPNDLLIKGKKIAGILAEAWEEAVVVGVGVNINMTRVEVGSIGRPATSLGLETGGQYAVASVLERLLALLPFWLERWRKGGFSALRPDWLRRSVPLGTSMTVGDGDQRRQGTLAGFGPAGQLLLSEGNQVHEIWAGDVEL